VEAVRVAVAVVEAEKVAVEAEEVAAVEVAPEV
jgi:hypothetical protein